ncbi:hypothetical protein RM844_30270 [Streptomyces sp. DSM 44915]|uniref:Uncharacterized protein n=1 Tax=Streptomyces chisholmiae TaxID=3075540 RepID=A0ABU2K004_9ACTN|nr:hypothetical protein [Streptomyces sp. DSM 44915]MDT0270567.1 hypothetical protein [Streptomyces sp. DSM 44915]
MARVSKILEAVDGSFVFAEAVSGGQFRVVCSACPKLADTRYRSRAGAILAASYHADHDPAEQTVPKAGS